MSRQRITEEDVDRAYTRVVEMMNNDLHLGVPVLHAGSHENGITNKLMLGRTNLWTDGMAGTTKRDCFNALRVMAATLGTVIDHQDTVRRMRAMNPNL